MHRIPIVANIQELAGIPRRFLLFTAFNVVTYHSFVGTAMVLFARSIDMPASWVGLLIAFAPLSMLMVMFIVPLVDWLGSKRLILVSWCLSVIVICSVFALPWVLKSRDQRLGWYVLLGATLLYSSIRSMGIGGWFPWLHEVVPQAQRQTYFSAEVGLSQLVTVAVVLAQSFVLHGSPGVSRFLSLYGVGIAAALISIVWMSRLTGGGGRHKTVHLRRSYGELSIALRDKAYRRFLLIAFCCFSAMSWLGSSLVMYMRDVLGYTSNAIMLITACSATGVFLTIRYWGRFAAHSGNGLAMFKTMFGHAFGAFACLALWPDAVWTRFLLPPTMVWLAIVSAAFFTAGNSALLDYVKPEGKVGYTNFWTVTMALAMGITPIVAGSVIDHLGLWGFRVCFVVAAAGGMAGGMACMRHIAARHALPDGTRELINPAIPVRTLARVVWISLGLDESNQSPGTTVREARTASRKAA